MTAPQSTVMTPSRSLAENLSHAHIGDSLRESNELGSNSPALSQDQPLPVITPQHQQLREHPFTLEKEDSYYVLPKCTTPSAQKFDPVKVFVEKAVKSRLQPSGDPSGIKAYKVILDAIRRKEDASLLHLIFLAIRTAGNGSTLHELSGNPTKHAQLLHVILRFDPFLGKSRNAQGSDMDCPYRNYSIADAYFNLILALVSANSVYLVPSMTSLWKLLTELTNFDPPLARTQRIHATLAALTRLCPKARTEIFAIISANFPFRSRPEKELVWCYEQTFHVVEYVPSIHGQVLQFVIEKCLEMDVEIKIHDGGEVTLDDEADNKDDGIFDLEMETTNAPKEVKKDVTVDEMAEKLDALMLLTFQFLEKTGQNDVVEARKLYERCLPAFESSILITHRSKFVQFIVFYLCGLERKAITAHDTEVHLQDQVHANLYREFCSALIQIVFDPYRSTVVRQCAACYLASFLSRANYAEADTICESLCALLRWADAYMGSVQADSVSAADARDQCDLHLLFYTISQAAFYIMCFRGREAVSFFRSIEEYAQLPTESVPEHLRDIELNHVDISPSRWGRLCGNRLEPLKYCLETVREEFLNIADAFNLLESGLLERLKSEHLRQASSLRRKKATVIKLSTTLQETKRNRASNPLDSFFPFDPYLLRQSHPFIEPFYRNWGEDPEDDEVDDDSVDDMAPADEESEASVSSSDDESNSSEEEDFRHQPASFEDTPMMSSTPPRPHDVLAAPREAWTDTLKRSRAPSIENGSW